MFLRLKTVLLEIHLTLTPDREHQKVFEKVSINEFRRTKGLKDILVRAKVAPLEKKKDCCKSTFVSALLCILFHTKHAENITQLWLKDFNLNLATSSQLIGVSFKS